MISPIKRTEYSVAYLYILPFFLLFLIFGLGPIVYSFVISFTRQPSFGSISFVGFTHYVRLFEDPLFKKALWNTVLIWISSHIIIIPGGFLLAYLLNSYIRKGQNFLKTLYFSPMITSSVAISLVFFTIFGKNFGIINQLLTALGLEGIDWFGGKGQFVKPMIVIIFAWKWIGYNMVIYLAGMQGIDPAYYESALVEGASSWKILIHITLPLMKPILLFTIVMSFIGGFQIFEEPFILLQNSGGEMGAGTAHSGLVIARYLQYLAFTRWQFGYASAGAYFLVIIIVSLTVITNRLMKEDQS